VQPAALSLTQATELGTVYQPAEIAALSKLAHGRGLKVHLEGRALPTRSRSLTVIPRTSLARGCRRPVLRATKNVPWRRAVVFFDSGLVRDFELRRKRAGHLLRNRATSPRSCWRTWKAESGSVTRSAPTAWRKTSAAPRASLLHPVEANEVFVKLGVQRRQGLHAAASSSTTGARERRRSALVSPGTSRRRMCPRCAPRSRRP